MRWVILIALVCILGTVAIGCAASAGKPTYQPPEAKDPIISKSEAIDIAKSRCLNQLTATEAEWYQQYLEPPTAVYWPSAFMCDGYGHWEVQLTFTVGQSHTYFYMVHAGTGEVLWSSW